MGYLQTEGPSLRIHVFNHWRKKIEKNADEREGKAGRACWRRRCAVSLIRDGVKTGKGSLISRRKVLQL